jgi:uncharacterized membrane protein
MAMVVGDAHQKIETYLGTLRTCLRGINEQDVRDIVEELRGHILEKASVSGETTAGEVDAALASLGSPEDLAGEYMMDNLLARVEVSRSPVRILGTLFRWASLSAAGVFVLVCATVGYFLGVAFILTALLKPFHLKTAGLWIYRTGTGALASSLRLGFGSPPVGGSEVLGWWIVPIGLVVGFALVLVTSYFALWCARQFRRSRTLPGSLLQPKQLLRR